MELTNTGNDFFDPISELLFLDHPGFYPAATPAHCGVTANPEVLRHLRQRPVATPLHQIHRYFARLCSLSPPLPPRKMAPPGHSVPPHHLAVVAQDPGVMRPNF